MRVAVTASLGRLEALEARLLEAGYAPLRAPLVAIAPLPDAAAAARALLGLDWRLYPSRSAVDAWSRLELGFADRARIGAVGPGTAGALARAGATVAVVPARATAEALAHAVLAHPDGPRRGDRVGLVQGDRARPLLARILRSAGVEVRVATLYAARGLGWSVVGAVDAVVLASPSAVAALPPEVAARSLLIAIGPTTAAAAGRRGWATTQAPAPTVEGVLAALARWRDAASAPAASPTARGGP